MGLHAQKVLMRPSPPSLRHHHVAAPPPLRREFGRSPTDTGAKGTSAGLPRRRFPCQSLLLRWHCRWGATVFPSVASDASGTSGRLLSSSAALTCHPAVITAAKGSLTTAAPPQGICTATRPLSRNIIIITIVVNVIIVSNSTSTTYFGPL